MANYLEGADHDVLLEEITRHRPRDPAVFYHGSASVNIDAFQTVIEFSEKANRPAPFGLEKTSGLFFSQSPVWAAQHAHRWLKGGRIYRSKIHAKATYTPPLQFWTKLINANKGADGEKLRGFETQLIDEIKADGFDSIASIVVNGCILEMIVLQDDIVERLDSDVRRLPEWDSPKILDALFLWMAEGAPGPDYAPEAVQLYANRKQAGSFASQCQRVLVNPATPMYCEREAWPDFNFDALSIMSEKEGKAIDFIIDTRGGGALVFDPEIILPINRKQMNALLGEAGRTRTR